MKIVLTPADDERELALVHCPEMLLKMFPGVRVRPGPPITVLLTTEKIRRENGKIVLDAASLSAPLLGEPGLAILVSDAARAKPSPSGPAEMQNTAYKSAHSDDGVFLHDVDADLTNPALRQIAHELLKITRELELSGYLKKGQARKFVNYPDNFVGFTVQTRNQALLVYVRESSVTKDAKA